MPCQHLTVTKELTRPAELKGVSDVRIAWGTKNHVCFDFVHLRLKKSGYPLITLQKTTKKIFSDNILKGHI